MVNLYLIFRFFELTGFARQSGHVREIKEGAVWLIVNQSIYSEGHLIIIRYRTVGLLQVRLDWKEAPTQRNSIGQGQLNQLQRKRD